MNYIYIVIAAAFLLLLISFLLIKKILSSNKSSKKVSGNIKKKIEKLKSALSENPKDYMSMYQLALLEDEIGENENALKRYEKLLNVSFFQGKEEIDLCKKVEDYYDKIANKEMSFKYAIKISKLEPNNIYYAIKVASILGKESSYLLACDYFNRVILSKSEFDIESIKVAIFSFFKIKEYKKCIVFLEELYKRMVKNRNNIDNNELNSLQKTLISMYILSDELNIAKNFIEQILIENNNENHLYFIDKMHLYIYCTN